MAVPVMDANTAGTQQTESVKMMKIMKNEYRSRLPYRSVLIVMLQLVTNTNALNKCSFLLILKNQYRYSI